MAALPTISARPDVVDSVLLLPVDQVEMGQRLRAVDPVWADALGRRMAAHGQRDPINVCQLPGRAGWTLVAGGHRLAGATSAGMAYIKAIVVTADNSERLMREVSENLERKELEPLERAAFVAQLVALEKVKQGLTPDGDGRFASAAVRWKKDVKDQAVDANDIVSFAFGWSAEVGEQLGFSQRTIERDILLHRRLPAGLAARLHGHPVLRNATQLRALAKLDDREQARVIDQLADGARNVSESLAKLRDNRRPQPEDKRLSAFKGAFQRMGLTEKKGALAQLADMLPAPWRLIEGAIQRWTFPPDHQRYRDEALARLDAARDVLEALIEDGAVDEDRIEAVQAAARGIYDAYGTIATDAVPMAAPR